MWWYDKALLPSLLLMVSTGSISRSSEIIFFISAFLGERYFSPLRIASNDVCFVSSFEVSSSATIVCSSVSSSVSSRVASDGISLKKYSSDFFLDSIFAFFS